MFEIVLRPLWWAAGNEQPSPPLHRAAAARLLRYFDKYNSLYTTNLLAIIFLEYNELYLSKHLSSRAAAARWRGGDGCSFPAAHQIGRSTISNSSGNSWEHFINVLRAFWTSVMQCCQWFVPPSWARLDCRHCTFLDKSIFSTKLYQETPPSVIHGWEATDLLLMMVKRKNYFQNPIGP